MQARISGSQGNLAYREAVFEIDSTSFLPWISLTEFSHHYSLMNGSLAN